MEGYQHNLQFYMEHEPKVKAVDKIGVRLSIEQAHCWWDNDLKTWSPRTQTATECPAIICTCLFSFIYFYFHQEVPNYTPKPSTSSYINKFSLPGNQANPRLAKAQAQGLFWSLVWKNKDLFLQCLSQAFLEYQKEKLGELGVPCCHSIRV